MWSLPIFLLLQATTSKEHCGWKSALVKTTLLAWQINLVSLDWYESQTTVCAPLRLPQPLPKLREPSPRPKSQTAMSSYPSGSASGHLLPHCPIQGLVAAAPMPSRPVPSVPRCHFWPPPPRWPRLPRAISWWALAPISTSRCSVLGPPHYLTPRAAAQPQPAGAQAAERFLATINHTSHEEQCLNKG